MRLTLPETTAEITAESWLYKYNQTATSRCSVYFLIIFLKVCGLENEPENLKTGISQFLFRRLKLFVTRKKLNRK